MGRSALSAWLARWRAQSPAPLRYTPAYLTYVAAVLTVAAVLAITTVHISGSETAFLIFGGVVGFAIYATAVPAVSGRDTHWSASGFVHLSQALVAGPGGALAVGIGSGLGMGLRSKLRDTRLPFNIAIFFLFNLAAQAAFWAIAGPKPSVWSGALAGAAAGAVQLALNVVLLDAAVVLSTPGQRILAIPKAAIAFIPYNIGYGWAAYGALLLYQRAGALGVSFLYVPVLLVQLFLINLGSRIEAEERERSAHQREREQLLERVINASQIERQRIARNLHDGVVQDLSVLMMGLRTAADECGDPGLALVMRRGADRAEDASDELRTLIRDIGPPNLAEVGLGAAIHDAAQDLRERGTACVIGVDAAAERGELAKPVFRIVQESLRNVLKHAKAGRVDVNARIRAGVLEVVVADDGAGFTEEQARGRREEGHIGLQLLSDLAREAGGELTIESSPGRGTRVLARFPLQELRS